MRQLLRAAACVALLASSAFSQTRTSSVIITSGGGTVRLNPPPSGNQQFTFPLAPNGSVFILSDANSEQSISGGLNIVGTNPLKIDGVAGTDGQYLGVSGGILGWYTPSGGGGGGVSTSSANSWTADQTFLTTSTQGGLFMSSLNASSTALDVNSGGTGQTSYADGELLIGNSTGSTLTKATLTAGAGVTITNGPGSITVAASAIPISGATHNAISGGTTYYHPNTTNKGTNTMTDFVRFRSPRTGVIRNFYVELDLSPGDVGRSRAFAIENLTTASSLTVTIADFSLSGSSGASTLAVTQGDILRIKQTPSGSPQTASAVWSFEIY